MTANTSQALAELERDIGDGPVDPVTLEELGLSEAVQVELIVDFVAKHIQIALQTRLSKTANKAVGNDQEYDRLWKAERAVEYLLGLVKRDHPRALALAKQLVEQEAERAQRERAQSGSR